jgi:hypothetical protein
MEVVPLVTALGMILGCGKMRAHYRTPKPGFVENGGFSGIFYLTL